MALHYYSDEKNTQVVVALLKAHGIRDIIISPGATNDRFVLSVQGDPDFNLYSAVDERHAGYLACGLAQMKGVPVVINCTGATASRNYMSALTEAFYRKLPILAITCSQPISHLGNMHPQMTDRVHLPHDIVNLSIQCPMPHTPEEEWDCNLKVNRALLELRHRGGGPVHINLETDINNSFTTEYLPPQRKVSRVSLADMTGCPQLWGDMKIIVWVGSHSPFSRQQENALEKFIAKYNAVVLTDLTSNYRGLRAERASLLLWQNGFKQNPKYANLKPDVIIHIGEISGDYPTLRWLMDLAPVWRVNEDGELRDLTHRLEYVFEMSEECFFNYYAQKEPQQPSKRNAEYAQLWHTVIKEVRDQNVEIPFSELWIAKELSRHFPEGADLHLGILNSLRCWNLCEVNPCRCFSTVGGFGIDGGTSSMIGSALAGSDNLQIGIFGDLAFFYDLNALGSRHISKNLRLVVVNNGEGAEFSMPGSISDNQYCGAKVHDYIAATGHFGGKSRSLVRHLAEDLGFVYYQVACKEDLGQKVGEFFGCEINRPAIMECFTDVHDDRLALDVVRNLQPYKVSRVQSMVRGGIKGFVRRCGG